MNQYEIDTLIQLTAQFDLLATKTPVDPNAVILYIENPKGKHTTLSYGSSNISKTSTGVYGYRLLLDEPGIWIYKWRGTGGVEVTSPDVEVRVNTTDFKDA